MTIRPSGRLVDLSDAEGGTEVMAEQLREVADSVRRLLNGRLTEKALLILIHASLPKGQKLSIEQIRSVLHAAARLDDYTKKGT